MKPCNVCGFKIKADRHAEEMGMCVDCSQLFWAHDHYDCSWNCVLNIKEWILMERGLM